MAKHNEALTDAPPDRRPLNQLQAARLSALTGLSAKSLAGVAPVDIGEKFKWQIDPELLLFRRICGKVVKKVNGVEYPVPFATVHVEDTDCSFLGFFPIENPFAWLFPIFCHREEIGTVKTDACGRFCVWIPRFEIDWILRFRRERICLPDVLVKPNIREILGMLEQRPVVKPHGPDPDPPPFLTKGGATAVDRAAQLLGRNTAERLAAIEFSTQFGSSARLQQQMLASDAFPNSLPPPLPEEFKKRPQGDEGHKAARETLATRLNLSSSALDNLNLSLYVGPFIRCFDIFVPEWVPVLDVPDITFRVTQDVNGDGTEETIYSEGFFDVRWNAGAIPDVTLAASQIAVAGTVCDVPDVPCADVPAIQFAGLMPLVNPPSPQDPYIDSDGYASRPNRPHPSGLISDPNPHPLAQSPFTHVLQLYGCNRIPNAAYYRLTYQTGANLPVPFTGLTWPVYRIVGTTLQTLWPSADPQGWYPVLPESDHWFPDRLLLEWPTDNFANGKYVITLEVSDSAKTPLPGSSSVALQIDNTAPFVQFTSFRWRKSGGSWVVVPPPFNCIVIPRGVVPSDIEIELGYSVSALHLRSMQLTSSGCGLGTPALISPPGTAEHWHTNSADNSVTNAAQFSVAATDAPGAYSFNLLASSRSFNPSGGDNGHLVDWNYDPVYNYAFPSLAVAIVNA